VQQLIYSFLIDTPDSTYASGELKAMASLWARSLRGAGRFEGDILLLTNWEIQHKRFSTKTVQVDQSPLHITTEKAMLWRDVPYKEYDFIGYD